MRIAAAANGPFHAEHVAALWSHVRARWRYVPDPRGNEYFARASESIENGLAGDCDDYTALLAASLQAIGGRARMVMVDGDSGGHAYAEVCIESPPDEVAERLGRFYRQSGTAIASQIHYRSDATCPVWLNLDWNAVAPGGPYGRERWAVAIHPDGTTETLVPATGSAPPLVAPP